VRVESLVVGESDEGSGLDELDELRHNSSRWLPEGSWDVGFQDFLMFVG
jgi:hypothetical protein